MDTVLGDVERLCLDLNEEEIHCDDITFLVTGGAGFLGSWICDVLVRLGSNVICIDNFSSGRPENVENLLNYNNFRLVEHDISTPKFFDEKIDVVLHFASRASPMEFSHFPIQILKANILGTWISLGIAKKHRATFVLASSSEVYGDPDIANIPTSENYTGNVNPVGPRSCYDEAKRASEAFATAYRLQHEMDTRIIRIFNTYGPRLRSEDVYGRVVSRFIDQAISNNPLTVFGDGSQTRSFIYVSDMVKGIIKVSLIPEASGEVLNLGNNVETKIITLAHKIKDLTSSNSEIEFHPLPLDDPKRRCPDIDKAQRLLRWKPEIGLEDGLLRTIKWFKGC